MDELCESGGDIVKRALIAMPTSRTSPIETEPGDRVEAAETTCQAAEITEIRVAEEIRMVEQDVAEPVEDVRACWSVASMVVSCCETLRCVRSSDAPGHARRSTALASTASSPRTVLIDAIAR